MNERYGIPRSLHMMAYWSQHDPSTERSDRLQWPQCQHRKLTSFHLKRLGELCGHIATCEDIGPTAPTGSGSEHQRLEPGGAYAPVGARTTCGVIN